METKDLLEYAIYGGIAWIFIGFMVGILKPWAYETWMIWGGVFVASTSWLLLSTNLQTTGFMLMLCGAGLAFGKNPDSFVKFSSLALLILGFLLIAIGLASKLIRNI